MPFAFRLLALVLPLALAACASRDLPVPQLVKPYRMEIQQGNFISKEMVDQLKPGMSKEQVRFVLGTPLVTDIFHADRWDYVYWREPEGGGKREQRNLSVVFEQGKLVRVIGDLLPSEAPQASTKPPAAKPEAPKPAAVAAPKPAAEAPKPVSEMPEPAPEERPLTQNWRAASDAPEAKPEPQAEEKKAEPEAPQAEEKKAEAGSQRRGFFDRLREKLRF